MKIGLNIKNISDLEIKFLWELLDEKEEIKVTEFYNKHKNRAKLVSILIAKYISTENGTDNLKQYQAKFISYVLKTATTEEYLNWLNENEIEMLEDENNINRLIKGSLKKPRKIIYKLTSHNNFRKEYIEPDTTDELVRLEDDTILENLHKKGIAKNFKLEA